MLQKYYLSFFLLFYSVGYGHTKNCTKNQVFELVGDNVRRSFTLYCPHTIDSGFYVLLWNTIDPELNCSNPNFCRDVASEHLQFQALKKSRLKNGTCTNYVFENLTEGHYCAKYCSINMCHLHTKTHHLKFENNDIKVEIHKPISNYSSTYVWFIVGIIVLLFAGLIFLVCKCHSNYRRLRPSPSFSYTSGTYSPTQSRDIHMANNTDHILILYNYDNDKHFKCVQKLAELLRSYFITSTIVIDRECIDDICKSGIERWVRSQLDAANRVIVISSEGASSKIEFRNKRMGEQNNCNNDLTSLDDNSLNPDTFLFGWTAITNNLNLNYDYKKLAHVRFEYTKEDHFTPFLVPQRNFVLPSQVDELLKDLLGHRSESVAKFLSDSRAFRLLKYSIQSVNSYSNNEETHWIRPGL